MMISIPELVIFIIITIAIVSDIRVRRIPNWLTFSAMIAGIGYHIYVGGITGLLLSLGGLLIGFSLFFVFYMLGGMGAGDVKLMAAIGSLLGPKDVLFAALYTALAGGVYAVLLMVTRKTNRELLSRYALMAKSLLSTGHCAYIPQGETEKTTPLCYGVAIAAGTLVVLLQKVL
jgi:prepilin peptidase CpaA